MVCNKSGNWREPNSTEKASIMGHNPDCFCGGNLSENTRLGIIGKAWDLHAIVGLFILTQELEEPITTHAHNLSVHFTHIDTQYHKQLCDFRQLSNSEYVLGQGQDRKTMPWAKIITQGLQDVTSKELIKPMIPVANMNKNNPKRVLGFPVSNPVSARSKKANPRRQRKKIICGDVQVGNRNWWHGQFQSTTAETVASHDSRPQTTEHEPSNMICLHADAGPPPLDCFIDEETPHKPSAERTNADIADTGSCQRWDPWENDETWLDALQDPMGPLAESLNKLNSRKWLKMRTGFTIQHEHGNPTTPRRLCKIQGLHKLAVPKPQERKALITKVHSTNGHWGVNRTLALLAKHHWMPQMKEKVEEVVKGCDACQRTRATFDGHHPILHPCPSWDHTIDGHST